MLLKKIKLKNFRQFYGEQQIDISTDPEKNVTLIHAENGVGKTTILNAILWCFYKYNTNSFSEPTKIISNQAVEEEIFDYSVSVTFSHDNEEYIVERKCNQLFPDNENFIAFKIIRGNHEVIRNPTVFVESIVPKEMAKYFFIDGEFTEKLGSPKNKDEIRNALEDMLGCRIANIAIADLKFILNNTEKSIAGMCVEGLSKKFQETINRFESENTAAENELEQIETNLKSAKIACDEIQNKLRGLAGVGVIQENREEFEIQKRKLEVSIKKLEGELTKWIYDFGISLITRPIEEKTKKMLADAKVDGKLPSLFAKKFVTNILCNKNCICERSFEENSAEYNAIKNLLKTAGTEEVDDRLMRAKALIETLSNKRELAQKNYEDLQEKIQYEKMEIDRLETKIDECHRKLAGSDNKEVSERENALKDKNKEIGEYERAIGRLETEIKGRKSEIVDFTKKRDLAIGNTNRSNVFQKRKSIITSAVNKIEEELEKYREEARNQITNKINEILEVTTRRSYNATIDKQFNLNMVDSETRQTISRSTGETQLLTLAFISALIKFSANRMQDQEEILKPGTSSPLVLDSPFGALDQTYQQSSAGFLPKMAQQVILLLSSSQFNGNVSTVLQGKIGKEYILVSENKINQTNRTSDTIKINGAEFDCSLYNRDKNQTVIVPLDKMEKK
jgi:DNA sulfur modification protein DndD